MALRFLYKIFQIIQNEKKLNSNISRSKETNLV